MDINRLIRVSGMDPELEDKEKLQSLEQDLQNIVELIAQLPDPIAMKSDQMYERFMTLAEDEFDKKATKEEILSNTSFKAEDMFKIG